MLALGIGRALSGLSVLATVFVILPERPLLALVIDVLFVYLPVYRLLQRRRDRDGESGDHESDCRLKREW